MPIAEVSVATASTVIKFFSPAKSPFYLVVASAIGALYAGTSPDILTERSWYLLIVPGGIVLLVSVLLSLFGRTAFLGADNDEQIRFARSFGLSSSLICTVFSLNGATEANLEWLYFLAYAICVGQALIFLLYSWVRSYEEEDQRDFNFVQLGLITSGLLIGATVGVYLLGTRFDQEIGFYSESLRLITVVIGCYTLWLLCFVYWVRHIVGLISIPGAKGGSV